jgi:hypothetical protein
MPTAIVKNIGVKLTDENERPVNGFQPGLFGGSELPGVQALVRLRPL